MSVPKAVAAQGQGIDGLQRKTEKTTGPSTRNDGIVTWGKSTASVPAYPLRWGGVLSRFVVVANVGDRYKLKVNGTVVADVTVPSGGAAGRSAPLAVDVWPFDVLTVEPVTSTGDVTVQAWVD